MDRFTSLAIFLFCAFSVVCGIENKARYDNYRLYHVTLKTDDHVKLFQQIEEKSDSYEFYGHARHTDQKLTFLVAPHKIGQITYLLKKNIVEHTILSENFQEKIDREANNIKPIGAPISEFGWENYYHLETIYSWMDMLVDQYQGIVSPLVAGQSYNGVPLRGVKISFKPNNTAVFVEGGIHAREWISPATVTYIMNQLLTSNDVGVRDIAQNFDWIIFPVFNPDGYKTTFESERLWRKTRQSFGLCLGTDLNRNWDSHWNETGASSDPCRYDFAGSSVFSEPESKQLSDYILKIVKSQNIRTYLSFHSFSQLLMFPSSATSDKVSNYDDLKAIGASAVAAIKQRYGTIYNYGSVYETIYPASGSSTDWAYEKAEIPIAYTFELRGPPNSTDMFNLPAEQILPTATETLDGVVALLNEARARGYYDLQKVAASQNTASMHIQNTLILCFLTSIIHCVTAY